MKKGLELSKQFGVEPAGLYTWGVERGFETDTLTLSTDQILQVLVSLFRADEVISLKEVVYRLEQHDLFELIGTKDTYQYVRRMLARHTGDKGRQRFTRLKWGTYRLQLSPAELRAAILSELTEQKGFVGSRRLLELFDISYPELVDVMTPLTNSGKVASRLNATTENRDWCLSRYADLQA